MELMRTAAFRPRFLSSFGDRTDCVSWVIAFVAAVVSCSGRRTENKVMAASTTPVIGEGGSG